MDEDQSQLFERAGTRGNPGLVAEFWLFLKENKKFWLLPPLVALFLLGLIAALGGTAAAPFIYNLF